MNDRQNVISNIAPNPTAGNGYPLVPPRLGRDVFYCFNDADVAAVIQRRRNAGLATASGNEPRAGQIFPGRIVADFGTPLVTHLHIREQIAKGVYVPTADDVPGRREVVIDKQLAVHDEAPKHWAANIQVYLDGYDTFWATSRSQFDPDKHGRWVQVVNGVDEKLPQDVGAHQPSHDEWKARSQAEHDIQFRPDAKGHWFFPEPEKKSRREIRNFTD